MNNIEQLLDKLTHERTHATMNIDDVHPNVRAAWGVAINEAKGRLPSIEKDWLNTIQPNTVAIFVLSDPQKGAQFAAIAKEEGNTFNVDAEAIYRQIAQDIEPMIGPTRELAQAQVSAVHMRLFNLMNQYGLVEKYTQPKLDQFRVVNNVNEVTVFVRDYVRAAVGDALNAAILLKQVAGQAEAARYTGGIVPVVITNVTEVEINGLSAVFGKVGSIVNITPETTVTTELVTDTFKTTKKTLKSKKNP